MRLAVLQDAPQLLSWRNSIGSRRFSRSDSEIQFNDHLSWLKAKLDAHSEDIIFIFSIDSIPIGMTRLDLVDSNCYEISVIVDKDFQSQGLGKQIVQLTCHFAENNTKKESIRASIRHDNLASKRIFTSLGFVYIDIKDNFENYKLIF